MNKTELLEIISKPEDAQVEFKRDSCTAEDLAKEMCALLNLDGGIILLGVEDNGEVTGLKRLPKSTEEWTMNIARENVQPAISPTWECIELDNRKKVGVIKLAADSVRKPYQARRKGSLIAYVRVGSTSREATREELARLFQASGIYRYEKKFLPNTSLESLDMERIENYFRVVLKRESPEWTDAEGWQRLLLNSDLLIDNSRVIRTSVAGMLLFGNNPNRYLPQAGVTAAVFPGEEKDYATIDEERIRGPLTPIYSNRGTKVDSGVIDRTVDFVKRNMGTTAWLDGARRRRKGAYSLDAIREAIVNAVVHRDYSREGTDLEVSLYCDRIEIISPGKLPNGVTVEKMKEGVVREARNNLLKEILRDYGYIEHHGFGVRNRIIAATLQHNNTEPDLVEDDFRFLVRIWKTPKDD